MNKTFNFTTENENEANNLSIYSASVTKNYSNFLEEHNIKENEDIIRCLKRISFGKGQLMDCDSLSVLIPTFKKLIEDVCGLTVDKYERAYNVSNNKQMHAENISRKITAKASDEIKEECVFDRKSILFKMVWPDYYEANFTKIKYSDIFKAKGELKAGLIRAAKPIDEDSLDRKQSDGAIVDKIIFKAIKSTFESAGFNNNYRIMEALAREEKLNSIGKKVTPGALLVIKERKCYANALDFYFLNMPREDQLLLVDDFMELREKSGKPREMVLDIMYQAFKENEEAFFATLE